MCKYGNSCTFAHGEQELRPKSDNPMFGGNQENTSMPQYMQGFPSMPYFDPNMFGGMGMQGMGGNNMGGMSDQHNGGGFPMNFNPGKLFIWLFIYIYRYVTIQQS